MKFAECNMTNLKKIWNDSRNKSLGKSINVFHCASGTCNNCDIEICACVTPRYDLERFGITFVGSIKHADVMFFTGCIIRHCIPMLKNYTK
jgi:Ni,Fe-hydrogenase III small subunit